MIRVPYFYFFGRRLRSWSGRLRSRPLGEVMRKRRLFEKLNAKLASNTLLPELQPKTTRDYT
jgi:hypothetical protein